VPLNIVIALRTVVFLAFSLLVTLVSAGDSETTGLVAMRRERPAITGQGIAVAQPEGQESLNGWQVNPVYNSGAFFTWSSALGTATTFPNAVGVESSHANGVAIEFYSIFGTGVAPGVSRVDNYDVEYFLTNHIQRQIPFAGRVINQSFVLPPPLHSIYEPLYDAFAANYDVLFVSGTRNVPDTVVAPATMYNGIGVGIISDLGQSSVGPTSDGRSKPDIVAPYAPAPAASFTTPRVAGAAALLLQAGAANDGGANTASLATNASVLKALLLNGAVKMTNWTNGFRRPLDARYGAGVLNMYNSDLQLRGGRHPASATNSVSLNGAHPPTGETNNVASRRGWDFSTIQSAMMNDRVAHYYFHLPTNSSAYSATATLVWKKGTGTLTNLDLFLYETTSNTLVTCSTSSVDNVEHLFVSKLPAGRYDLQVLKRGSVLSGTESYALAFDFSPVKLTAGLSGTNVVVSWPASPAGFTLQAATSLSAPIVWENISATNSILSNAMNTVTVPSSSAKYFRLYRP
jgi:hypothetical protein